MDKMLIALVALVLLAAVPLVALLTSRSRRSAVIRASWAWQTLRLAAHGFAIELRWAWAALRYGALRIAGGAEISSPEGFPAVMIQYFQLVLSPAACGANTTAEQTFSVPAQVTMGTNTVVTVSKPTAQAGLGIVGARRASATTIGITFSNNTAAPITPTASEVYTVCVMTRAF